MLTSTCPTLKYQNNMHILQSLGVRSLCCNAPFHFKEGWDYKTDGWVCSVCGEAKAHHIKPSKRTETINKVSMKKMKQEAKTKLVVRINKKLNASNIKRGE